MDLVLVEGLASQKLVNLAQICLFLGRDKVEKRRIDAKKWAEEFLLDGLSDCKSDYRDALAMNGRGAL